VKWGITAVGELQVPKVDLTDDLLREIVPEKALSQFPLFKRRLERRIMRILDAFSECLFEAFHRIDFTKNIGESQK
jgi:hypothetical protein